MKHIYAKAIWYSIFFGFMAVSGYSQSLIISQYYESGGTDRYIEITNTGSTSANLSGYSIGIYSNPAILPSSGASPTTVVGLGFALLPAGGSAIYRSNTTSNPAYATGISTPSANLQFDGNDIIILTTGSGFTAWDNRVDIIGEVGFWGEDTSFVRGASFTSGSQTYNFFEWTGFSISDVNNANAGDDERLGEHNFIAPCVAPTFSASNLLTSDVSVAKATISWDHGADADSSLVVVSQSPVAGAPVDPNFYFADTVFNSFQDILNPGEFIMYSGGDTVVTISGLASSTTYYYSVFEYNSNGVEACYNASAATGSFTTLACTGPLTSLPTLDDFETGSPLSGPVVGCQTGTLIPSSVWTNVGSDDTDWLLFTGPTATASTGPSSAAFGSNYLIVEADCPGDAILESGCIDLSGTFQPELIFDYHMWGSDIVSLVVEVSVDGGVNYNLVQSINGDQGNSWFTGVVDLSAYAGEIIKIRITATQSGIYGDFGIDHIELVESSLLCTPPFDPPSGVTLSNITDTSAKISWTNGPSADSTIVIVSEEFPVFDFPQEGIVYSADSVFDNGQDILGLGEYVVFYGTEDSVTVTGLSFNTTYYVTLIDYYSNGGNPCYSPLTADTSFTTAPLPVDSTSSDFNTIDFFTEETLAQEAGDPTYLIRLQLKRAYDQSIAIPVNVELTANMAYGIDFTTNPAVVGNTIMLTIPPGSRTATIQVNIVDDNQAETDLSEIYFIIDPITNIEGLYSLEQNFHIVSVLDGRRLEPGDLIITAFNNDFSPGRDEYVITPMVDIPRGTRFSLVNARYEAGAAANQRTNLWGNGDPMVDLPVGNLEIAYSGIVPIPAGESIRFETAGSGTSATNFRVNCNPTSEFASSHSGSPVDFSNIFNEQIYLTQGFFFPDLTGTRDTLIAGKVLYGLTNGTGWVDITSAVPSGSSNAELVSRIPPDISCLGLELPGFEPQYFYPNDAPIFSGDKETILAAVVDPSYYSTSSYMLNCVMADPMSVGRPFNVVPSPARRFFCFPNPENPPNSINVERIGHVSATTVTDNPGADGYLMFIKEGSAPTTSPEDMIFYKADSSLGDGQALPDGSFVLAFRSSDTLRIVGLEPLTEYYLSAWAFRRQGDTVLYSQTQTDASFNTAANPLALPTNQPDAPNGRVNALARYEEFIFVGGSFSQLGTTPRQNLAIVDTTNALVAVSLNTNGPVHCLYVKNDTLYVGGSFTEIAGVSTVENLARVSISGFSVDTSFTPSVDGPVFAMTMAPSQDSVQLYIGGNFENVNGQPRANLAKINTLTGALGIIGASPSSLPYPPAGHSTMSTSSISQPELNGSVLSMAHDGSNLFVGGDFTMVGTDSIRHLAKFEASTGGSLDAGFNPNPDGYVCGMDIVADLGELVIGGGFSTVTSFGSDGPGRTAKIGTVVGNVRKPEKQEGGFAPKGGQKDKQPPVLRSFNLDTVWNPNPNGSVCDVQVVGGAVFLGGDFTELGDSAINRFGVVDLENGEVQDFQPNVSGPVEGILAGPGDSTAIVAGNFSSVAGENQGNLASVALTPAIIALPIELLSFTAEPDRDNNVRLEWTVLDESSTEKYYIMRGKNASSMRQIHSLESAGKSDINSYSYLDTDLEDGVYYYQLRFEDEGAIKTGPIRAVEINRKAEMLARIAPNPLSANAVLVMESEELAEEISFELRNAQGAIIIPKTQGKEAINTVLRQQVKTLQSGLYHGYFTYPDRSTSHQKLIVIH